MIIAKTEGGDGELADFCRRIVERRPDVDFVLVISVDEDGDLALVGGTNIPEKISNRTISQLRDALRRIARGEGLQ